MFLKAFMVLFCLQEGGLSQGDVARETLKRKTISVQFRQTPFLEAIDLFRDFTGVNILVDPLVSSRGELPVSLFLQSVSVRSALSLLVQSLGFAWVWKEGVIWVTTREKARQRVRMKIYDVRDLLHPLQDFPGVELQLGGSSLGGTFSDDDEDPVILPLEEILQSHTGGKSWVDHPKTSLSLVNGLLIVRQSEKVHREIRILLAKLRRNK